VAVAVAVAVAVVAVLVPVAVAVAVFVCRFITSSGVMSAICDTSVAQRQGQAIVRIALGERAPPSS
jgi:hypothetical protein